MYVSHLSHLCPSYHYQLFTTVFKGSDQTADHIHSANSYLKRPNQILPSQSLKELKYSGHTTTKLNTVPGT